jgi:hypothetical protein
MPKRKLSPQTRMDRALCPVTVSQILAMKVAVVAESMRRSGVEAPMTDRQARLWKTDPSQASDWFLTLLADQAAHAAKGAYRRAVGEVEAEHRTLLLTAEVEARLLSGRRIRGYEAEFIASDFAFRAMKELVRCQGDTEWLLEIDLAALKWAGVDPADPDTWFLRAGP